MKYFENEMIDLFDKTTYRFLRTNLRRAVEVHSVAGLPLYLVDSTECSFYKHVWPKHLYLHRFNKALQDNQIEAKKPEFSESFDNELIPYSECLESVNKYRDKNTKNIDVHSYFNNLDRASKDIFKKSYKTLGLTYYNIKNIFKLCEAIRVIAETDKVQASFLCEAISYVTIDN